MSSIPQTAPIPASPEVAYATGAPTSLLEDRQLLALLGYAPGDARMDDPRAFCVHAHAWPRPQHELWRVTGPVQAGRAGPLQWAEGSGWLFVAVDQADDGHDMGACARAAYQCLTGFLADRPGYHVQRIWNYLDGINEGNDDGERYRQFCAGRRLGMNRYFEASGFPAATAVGHAVACGKLQVYCLAALEPGQRIENPRQLSAWRYPRQYGPVSPSFARAMRLPDERALAISGTAAIHGHASQHHGDLGAQLGETLTNLGALLAAGAMPGRLGARSPLKVYVRHAEHMAEVDDFLAEHLPDAPRLLLQADICRRELLVEIDGWHFA